MCCKVLRSGLQTSNVSSSVMSSHHVPCSWSKLLCFRQAILVILFCICSLLSSSPFSLSRDWEQTQSFILTLVSLAISAPALVPPAAPLLGDGSTLPVSPPSSSVTASHSPECSVGLHLGWHDSVLVTEDCLLLGGMPSLSILPQWATAKWDSGGLSRLQLPKSFLGVIAPVCLPCDSSRTRVRFSATSVPFSNKY